MATVKLTAKILPSFGIAQSDDNSNWDTALASHTVIVGSTFGIDRFFYMQLQPGISGKTITKATLRLFSTVDDANARTYQLRRHSATGDLSSGDNINLPLSDLVNVTSGALTINEWDEIDVTDFVNDEMFQGADDEDTVYTLQVRSSADPLRAYQIGRLDPVYAPELVLEYEGDQADERDPLTKAYDWLAGVLREDPKIANLVRPGNLILYNADDRDPAKREVMDADFPEIRLDPADGEVQFYQDSRTTRIAERFNVEISTGDRRLAERLNPVRFAVLQALSKWTTSTSSTRWNGNEIILDVSIVGVQNGEADEDAERGIKGWASRIVVQILLQLRTADLQA